MSASGFNAVADDLRLAASSVGAALDGAAGFTMESNGANAYGHDALHATMQKLCSTLPRAVQVSGLDAAAAGEALGVAARAYTDSDEQAELGLNRAAGEE